MSIGYEKDNLCRAGPLIREKSLLDERFRPEVAIMEFGARMLETYNARAIRRL